MAPRVRNFLQASLLLGLGICCVIPQRGEAEDSPYYALELNSALDSQPKQSVTIGLLEAGASEWMDVVPPPEPTGFDFYIASGLAFPWDRLSLHLIPQVPGQNLYSWRVVAVAPTTQEVIVSWDASDAPDDVSPYFVEVDPQTGQPVGDLQDMNTTTSFIVRGGALASVIAVFEFQMHLGLPPSCDYTTTDHATEIGAIAAGSCQDTRDQDNLAEALTEAILEKGKPSKRHDELSHVWTFEVTGGKSAVFYLDACKTSSPDGDDFLFSYSMGGVSYVDMFTVTKTADDDSYQCCELPNTVKGVIYVRAQDTDRSPGNQNLDILYVDHMFILCSDSPPDLPPEAPQNLTATAGDAQITLVWDDNGEIDLDRYCVYRSPSPGGPYVWLADSLESIYADDSVDNGTRYYYVVTTVDMAGQESGFSHEASALPGASPIIRVASIEMSTLAAGKKWSAVATVTVLCQNGYPVEGAVVGYTWSGIFNSAGEALTESNGVVAVASGSSPKAGTTVFTVTEVSQPGRIFDQGDSVKSGSVTGP